MAKTPLASTIAGAIGVVPDDAAVLSVVYERREHEWQLRHGSLIFGPPELATHTWCSWHELNASRLHDRAGDLGVAFAHEQNGLLIARAVLSPADVHAVLESLGSGAIPALGSLPPATAELDVPPSPIRVFPHQSSEAGRLTLLAGRPMQAFLFALTADPTGPPFPDNWTIDGKHVYAPDRWEVGVVASHSAGPVAPAGLLLGRLERRAWIREMRGVDDELHYYRVSIGLDPTQITPYDLVVELREWVNNDLAAARRLSLEWLDLSAWSGEDHFELTLPMLGSGAKRAVSLYDLGGELLDLSDAHYLVETIHLTMNAVSPDCVSIATSHSVIGTKLERALDDRLARLASIDDEYRQLIADGLANRVVLRGTNALPYLRQRLEAAARGEILVTDRYFGSNASDWQLFDNLPASVRVLVSKPKHRPPKRPGLQVKRWQRPASGGPPPFHDRVFLWDGGGLSVGTSPGGLGASDSRIDSLDPAESELLTARFNQLWASPDFSFI
jgi:hypothetical protein